MLHKYTSLIPSIARTPDSAIYTARATVHRAHADRLYANVPSHERVKPVSELPVWSKAEMLQRHGERVDGRRRVLLMIEGFVVDVGGYIDDHVSERLLETPC